MAGCDNCGPAELSTDVPEGTLRIALAGNPNTGKSSIFNSLTGAKQHVGNWPGKTVARAHGTFCHDGRDYEVVDLPGIYSLNAASPEEIIARDYLVSGEPDWLGAQMIFDHETDIVTVLATWQDTSSYKRLKASSEFQQTMQRFSELFASPPEISMNQLLVDMKP